MVEYDSLASWSADIIDDSMKAIVIFCSDIPFWPAFGGVLTVFALLLLILFKK